MRSFLSIIALALLVTVCAAIGQGDNEAAKLAAAVFFVGSIALYFAPAYVAHSAGHPQRLSITVLNTLLGWTVLGWVVSLVWAYTRREPASA